MKQYKDLRDGFKQFINESVVVGLQPLKEEDMEFNRSPQMHQDVRGTEAEELFTNLEKLDKELKEYKSIIKDLETQSKQIEGKLDEIIRPMNLLNGAVIRYRDKAYMVIDRVASTSTSVSYKDLWETSLTKVNDATKKVLLQLKADMTKITKVKASLSRVTEEGTLNEGFLSGAWGKLKNLLVKATSFFTNQERVLDDILAKFK